MSYILILNASHIVQSLWRQRQVQLRKRYIEVNFMITHITSHVVQYFLAVAWPGILLGAGGSTNSVEDKGQTERGSGGGSPPSQGFWR